MARILLIEPWLAGSHERWAEGYRASSGHDVAIVGLPGVAWRWRLRGGAVPLAGLVEAWVAANGRPDVLLVSGLVDVAHLLALTRRTLPARLPVVIYQHESQLVHPSPPGKDEQEAALRNWLSWCVADLVLFNSGHHLDAVSGALPGFLAQLPDRSHLPLLDRVLGRFEVLPLGLDLAWTGAGRGRTPVGGGARLDGGPPVVLWPHRWEADKDPAAFAAALARAEAAGVAFRLVLAGEDPEAGSVAAAAGRAAVAGRFADRVVACGPFDRDRYRGLVSASDLVVSCARHEFFGAAVAEAVAAGCVPVLPRALAYPEVIPAAWHPAALYRPGRFGTALLDAMADLEGRRAAVAGLAATIDRFDWARVAPRFDERLDRVLTAAWVP